MDDIGLFDTIEKEHTYQILITLNVPPALMDNSTIILAIFLALTFLYAKKQNQLHQDDKTTVLKGVKYQEETEITTREKQEEEELAKKEEEEEEKEADLQERLHKPVIQVKRKVTIDMIEIVQTLAPNLDVKQIEYSLSQTGSIEKTVEDFLSGKMESFPSSDNENEIDESGKQESDTKSGQESDDSNSEEK